MHKTIADTIYGRIDITETEFELLHSPLLQRLRHISQTPGACFVFPSATHNRFAHSLGCLYMIDQMATALEIEDPDKNWLRCAALLHDVGHFPLSHTGEAVYGSAGQTAAAGFDGPPETRRDAFVWAGGELRPPPHAEHETMSALMVTDNPSLRRLLEHRSVPVQSVASAIKGELTGRSDATVFNFLMHSDLDADKMDYLVRDATLVGAKYGLIDADYLLKNLRPVDSEGGRQVAVSLSGLHSLEHALLSRFFMYCNVFFHKTVLAFDTLMRAVMKLMLEEQVGVLPPSLDSYMEMITEDHPSLVSFTDHAFWAGVGEAAAEGSPRLRRLASMLLHRNGPKCAYQGERFIKARDDSAWSELQKLRAMFGDDAKRRELAGAAEVDADDLTLVVRAIALPRVDDKGVKLVDAEGSQPSGLLSLEDAQCSSMLAQHVNEALVRVCVFVIEDPPVDKRDPSGPRNRVRRAVEGLLGSG